MCIKNTEDRARLKFVLQCAWSRQKGVEKSLCSLAIVDKNFSLAVRLPGILIDAKNAQIVMKQAEHWSSQQHLISYLKFHVHTTLYVFNLLGCVEKILSSYITFLEEIFVCV